MNASTIFFSVISIFRFVVTVADDNSMMKYDLIYSINVEIGKQLRIAAGVATFK